MNPPRRINHFEGTVEACFQTADFHLDDLGIDGEFEKFIDLIERDRLSSLTDGYMRHEGAWRRRRINGWLAFGRLQPFQMIFQLFRCERQGRKDLGVRAFHHYPHRFHDLRINHVQIDCSRISSLAAKIRSQTFTKELRRIFGDGVNQAADLVSGATSIPSRNLTPLMTFGN